MWSGDDSEIIATQGVGARTQRAPPKEDTPRGNTPRKGSSVSGAHKEVLWCVTAYRVSVVRPIPSIVFVIVFVSRMERVDRLSRVERAPRARCSP